MTGNRPTVLVTGGAGYIGSHAVLALLDAGYRVVAFDELPPDDRRRVDSRATFVEGTIANGSLLQLVLEYHRVGAIVHCAGFHSLDASRTDPAVPYRHNVGGFLSMLESAVGARVGRIVMLSSAAIYGPMGGIAPDESVAPRPCTALARSQWMAEQILADVAATHGIAACVLRPGLIAGADPLGRAGPARGAAFNPVFRALEVAFGHLEHSTIRTCPGATQDGTVVRGYVHVSDLADAVVAATSSLFDRAQGVATYNCGCRTGFSDSMVIEAVGRITAMRIRHRCVPASSGEAPVQVACADAIRSELAWSPRHDELDILVRDTLWWGMRGSQAAISPGDAASQFMLRPGLSANFRPSPIEELCCVSPGE